MATVYDERPAADRVEYKRTKGRTDPELSDNFSEPQLASRGGSDGWNRPEPQIYVVGPKGKHTHSVILLHGAYSGYTTPAHCEFMFGFGNTQSVPELVDAAAKPYNSSGDGIKYIFPCAPPAAEGEPWGKFWYQYFFPTTSPQWPQTADHNGYYESNAYMWQSDNDQINSEQWADMLGWLTNLVKQEVDAVGDASKVIIGGNSQGGTVAINAALNYDGALGALLCLRTCPMRETLGPVPARPLQGVTDGTNLKGSNIEMPIFCYIDGHDDTYIPPLQHRNYCLIQDAGYVVTTKVDPEKCHEDNDPAENEWAAKWIAESFFSKPQPTTRAVQTTARRIGLSKYFSCCSSKGAVAVAAPTKKDVAVGVAQYAGA